jgi:hypothetical protein
MRVCQYFGVCRCVCVMQFLYVYRHFEAKCCFVLDVIIFASICWVLSVSSGSIFVARCPFSSVHDFLCGGKHVLLFVLKCVELCVRMCMCMCALVCERRVCLFITSALLIRLHYHHHLQH